MKIEQIKRISYEDMKNKLLNCKVRLKDVPCGIRQIHTDIYFSAFRNDSRISRKMYFEDLQILSDDIQSAVSKAMVMELSGILIKGQEMFRSYSNTYSDEYWCFKEDKG